MMDDAMMGVSSAPNPSDPVLIYDQTPPAALFTNKIMISAIITLFCVIVFVLLLHLYIRWLWWRNPVLRAHGNLHSRTTIHRMSFPSTATADVDMAVTAGLSKSEIDLLPVFTYQKGLHKPAEADLEEQKQQPEEQTECAVCLSEFLEGEALRLLPLCRHCFHTECIDMWFYSHSTCPLCRAKVVAGSATHPAGAGDTVSSSAASPVRRSSEEEALGGQQQQQQLEEAGHFAFWENPTAAQGADLWMTSTSSNSSSPFPPTSRRQQRFMSMTGTRSLPHIRIDVPLSPAAGGGGPGSASNSSTTLSPPPALMSQEGASYLRSPLRSPGLRMPMMSIRRIILRAGSATEREECSGQPESERQEQDAASTYSKAASAAADASV